MVVYALSHMQETGCSLIFSFQIHIRNNLSLGSLYLSHADERSNLTYLQTRYAISRPHATGGKAKTPTCHLKLITESLFWLCLRHKISSLHTRVVD
jgi:hypothetical protein